MFMIAAQAQPRRPRDFKPQKCLGDICEREIGAYRFPRHVIEELVQGFSLSEFANRTERSHALTPETQVSVHSCLVLCLFVNMSTLKVQASFFKIP